MIKTKNIFRKNWSYLSDNKELLILLILLPLSIIWILFAFKSINFGTHWDEHNHINIVKNFANTKTLLPIQDPGGPFYVYPQILFWISMVGGGISILVNYILSNFCIFPVFDFSFTWTIITRSICVLLVIIPSIFACFHLGKKDIFSPRVGIFAGLLTLSSWQLSFHSKWIAPDALLVPAVFLFICAFINVWEFEKIKAYRPSGIKKFLPAIFAGLAASIKYQGGILIVSLFFACLLSPYKYKSIKEPLIHFLKQFLVFCIVFIVINPGSIIQTYPFLEQIYTISTRYGSSHGEAYFVFPHDINNFWEYSFYQFKYILISLPSSSNSISSVVSLFALIGMYSLGKKDFKLLLCISSWGILLFTYYSSLTIFIARNFLIYFPLIAFFFALGVDALIKGLRTKKSIFKKIRLDLAIFFFIFSILISAQINIYKDSYEIVKWKDRNSDWVKNQEKKGFESLISYNNTCVMVTPYISERHSKNIFSTKVSKTCTPTHYIFTQKDLRRIYDIHNNYRPDLFFIKQWSGIGKHDYKAIGPKEVDYNYYSTWEGENRTFVMDKRTYEKFFKPNAIESLSLELRKYINN